MAYLAGSATPALPQRIPAESFQAYLDKLLQDAGAAKDPIEKILVEQVAMAHHNIGRLYLSAARNESLEQVQAYHQAASRLLGELRRTVLALKKYREPTAPTILVKQQNVAGSQQVAYVDRERSPRRDKKDPDIEKGNNDSDAPTKQLEYAPTDTVIPQSAARGRRAEEPAFVERADPRGA
jgi:hypothetical protein